MRWHASTYAASAAAAAPLRAKWIGSSTRIRTRPLTGRYGGGTPIVRPKGTLTVIGSTPTRSARASGNRSASECPSSRHTDPGVHPRGDDRDDRDAPRDREADVAAPRTERDPVTLAEVPEGLAVSARVDEHGAPEIEQRVRVLGARADRAERRDPRRERRAPHDLVEQEARHALGAERRPEGVREHERLDHRERTTAVVADDQRGPLLREVLDTARTRGVGTLDPRREPLERTVEGAGIARLHVVSHPRGHSPYLACTTIAVSPATCSNRALSNEGAPSPGAASFENP